MLDLSVAGQEYIEDCFVCCQPIVVNYVADAGELVQVTADAG